MPDAIRVDPSFPTEFPGASVSAAELAANLVRTANELVAEVDRRRRPIAGLSASAFEALAVLDGAGEPLAAHQIAERLLVTTASMTSLLDTLARRGLVVRRPHPGDRRKILVEITPAAQEVVDRMLPVVHLAATDVFAAVPEAERQRTIRLLGGVRARLAELARQDPPAPRARVRPKRR